MRRGDSSLVYRHAPTPLWMAWAVSSSLALHALAGFGIGSPSSLHEHRPENPKSFVAFEVTPPKVEEAPPPKLEPKEPERLAPTPKAPKKVDEPKPPPEPPPSTPPPSAPAEGSPPPDLSGLTLTSDVGTGFALPAGNGTDREGALRVPAGLGRAPAPPPRIPTGAPKSPRIVAMKDLSARPAPPTLDGALERNYPKGARSRGLGGTATVRVRIDADGVARSVSILNESQPGFAEACQRTLRGSRWSAPRDRAGSAVATEIRYTCRFRVQP